MKRIISDYLRRRWLVLTFIAIGFFLLEGLIIGVKHGIPNARITVSNPHLMMQSTFAVQMYLFVGLLLVTDLRQGIARVLTSLPLTTREIGRALWLAAVALPAAVFILSSLLGLLFFSTVTHQVISWGHHLAGWIALALVLSGAFGALTFRPPSPETVRDKIRTTLSILIFLIPASGWFVLQIGFEFPGKPVLVFTSQIALVALTAIGWLRADYLVIQHAGFKPGTQPRTRNSNVAHPVRGFGGLAYLVKTTLVRGVLLNMLVVGLTGLFEYFCIIGSNDLHHSATYMFMNAFSAQVLVFPLLSVIPVVYQLRYFRTLPITPSALASTLILLPVLCIVITCVISLMIISFISPYSPLVLPILKIFLRFAAIAAIAMAIYIWRGIDALSVTLFVLLMISDSVGTLILMAIFRPSTFPECPLWAASLISCIIIATSIRITRYLVTRSTSYRSRPLNINNWGFIKQV